MPSCVAYHMNGAWIFVAGVAVIVRIYKLQCLEISNMLISMVVHWSHKNPLLREVVMLRVVVRSC